MGKCKQLPKMIKYKGVQMYVNRGNDMGFPVQTRLKSGAGYEEWSDSITYGAYDNWTQIYEAAYQHHKQIKSKQIRRHDIAIDILGRPWKH